MASGLASTTETGCDSSHVVVDKAVEKISRNGSGRRRVEVAAEEEEDAEDVEADGVFLTKVNIDRRFELSRVHNKMNTYANKMEEMAEEEEEEEEEEEGGEENEEEEEEEKREEDRE